jgi:hypothetical protein
LLAGQWNKGKDQPVTAADFFSPSRLKQNLSENIRLGLDLKVGAEGDYQRAWRRSTRTATNSLT